MPARAGGDYRVVAARLRPAAVDLVDAMAVDGSHRVLDLGAGSGNVTALCRERGAHVTALDNDHAQLLLLMDDPATAGSTCVVGDAHALPLGEESVDVVLSTFGVIYADDPETCVREMARVCRPGGRVGLTAWPEDGFQMRGQAYLAARLSPTGDAAPKPAPWSDPGRVSALLHPCFVEIEVERRPLSWRVPSLEAYWERIADAAPPLVEARASMAASELDELRAAFLDILRGCVVPGDEGPGVLLQETFLQVSARRP